MAGSLIQTTDLEGTFQALRRGDPLKLGRESIPYSPDYPAVPNQNYAPTTSVSTSWGSSGMTRQAQGLSTGIVYGQPQFFSPVHTPINWQIPSKRLEQYQWARFFYENEPKVASSIDFYAFFPMNDFDHECKNRKVKRHFDKLKKRIELPKWLRLISHEVHLLGDCFPFIEIECEHCQGSGRIGDELCEHEGGTVRRIVILNPDYVEVYTSPINPEPVIALKPDEELINMVSKRTPGYERLSLQVRNLISSGQPIRLDNRNVTHIKYGEGGYSRYGIGMVRRLFPILSYKTKLMVAQWIVAERLIVPIKIVKVGSDERPAGPADIAAVQTQLAQTSNDPQLTIVTHHAFELEWYGAAGKVLTLTNEFDFINQEILDGMMINNALLNGEGPNFSNAAVGIEAMIERLETYRREISTWVEEFIYRPEAIRQAAGGDEEFIEEDPETGEMEYVYPKIKWNSMHLRDQQAFRTFVLQLYEKGLLSAQTVLEVFDFNPDQEIERKRYDSVQMMAMGAGQGGMPGGDMGGGFGGMPGGGGPAGGDMEGPMGAGGAPPIGAPGGEMGAPGAGAAPVAASSGPANPSDFGGRVLKKKSRDKFTQEQTKIYNANKPTAQQGDAMERDQAGRFTKTKNEVNLLKGLEQYQENGLIRYAVYPQFPLKYGGREYPLDFGIPALKLGIEADGEEFHSSPEQQIHDKERDQKLAQLGWTIMRFTDEEIEKTLEKCMNTIVKGIMQKEMIINKQKEEMDHPPPESF